MSFLGRHVPPPPPKRYHGAPPPSDGPPVPPPKPFTNYRLRASVLYSPGQMALPPVPPPRAPPSYTPHTPIVAAASPPTYTPPPYSPPLSNYTPSSSNGDVALNISSAPVSEVLLVFNDVKYEISQGKKKPAKQLLKGVSGYAKSGQILAIMGPSGMLFHPSFPPSFDSLVIS
jgi:hypothetical protein